MHCIAVQVLSGASSPERLRHCLMALLHRLIQGRLPIGIPYAGISSGPQTELHNVDVAHERCPVQGGRTASFRLPVWICSCTRRWGYEDEWMAIEEPFIRRDEKQRGPRTKLQKQGSHVGVARPAGVVQRSVPAVSIFAITMH